MVSGINAAGQLWRGSGKLQNHQRSPHHFPYCGLLHQHSCCQRQQDQHLLLCRLRFLARDTLRSIKMLQCHALACSLKETGSRSEKWSGCSLGISTAA